MAQYRPATRWSLTRLLHRSLTGSFAVLAEFLAIATHPLASLLCRNRVHILCYHRICDLPETGDYICGITVSPSSFEEQMAYLHRKKFNVIDLDQYVRLRDLGKKPRARTVVITFDDGYADNHLIAFPILRKQGLTATFFLSTDYVDSKSVFPWLELGEEMLSHSRENRHQWLPLTTQQVLDMYGQGASFGSHGRSHRGLTDMPLADAEEEISRSKEELETLLAKTVVCFSYPYGRTSRQVEHLVKATGYKAAVTVAGGGNGPTQTLYRLRRESVGRRDSLARFRRKVDGAYDWLDRIPEVAARTKEVLFRWWRRP